MKYFLFSILLGPLCATAQRNKATGYFTANAGLVTLESIGQSPLLMVSSGVKIEKPGTGIGAGISMLQGFRKAYIPLFVELAFVPDKQNVAPYIAARIGKGIYNHSLYDVTTTGGLFFNLNGGISFSVKSTSRFLLGLGYMRCAFSTSTGNGPTSKTGYNGFSGYIGVVI